MPRKVIDYSNTVIYKIVCNDPNVKELYVGSTTDFKKRKYLHKSTCNNINDKAFNIKLYQTIRNNGGWENWDMIEIEKYPCNDGNEAHARERKHYDELNSSLNMIKPQITQTEKLAYCKQYSKQYRHDNHEKQLEYCRQYYRQYRHDNYEKQLEYIKQYNIKHCEKINEYQKLKHNCECGGKFTTSNKSNHETSIMHKTYINKQNV
jgi:hypothetical protein